MTDRMLEEHVRAIIRESVAESLKVEEARIDDDLSFSEYGVDSIIAVNLVNSISKRCGVTFQTTVLFDYSNVDLLTGHIIRNHASEMAARLGKHAPETEEPRPGPREEEALETDETGSRPSRGAVEKRGEERLHDGGPSRGKVRMRIESVSLNPGKPGKGGLCGISGVVVKTGEGVSRVKNGDPVMGAASGNVDGPGSEVDVDEGFVGGKPPNLAFEEAAAWALDFFSVYYALEHADVPPGGRILLVAPSDGVGRMAARLAGSKDVEIYISVDSPGKMESMKKAGVSHLLNHTEKDFERKMMALTNRNKIDVVIGFSDPPPHGVLDVLAPDGRFIEIGA